MSSAYSSSTSEDITFRLTTPELSVAAWWGAILRYTWKNLGLNFTRQAET
jgi:hypothetical protein